MNPRSLVVLAIFLVATACATDGTSPRKLDASDTGSRITLLAEDAPPLVIRPSVRRAPVEVTKEQYYAAMAQLAARLRNALPPRAPTGERYGLVMGEKVTRLLILAATAALASGGSKSISGGLPGLSQASRMATAEGLSFEVLGAVRSVQVTGRILTVSMESNALLMSDQGMSGNGGSQPPRPSSAAAATSSSKHRLTSILKPSLTMPI